MLSLHHQPAAAWSITPSLIQDAFERTGGTAPLFRPVDGAVCPSADVSTLEKRGEAYSLVLNKGLIRVFIPLPAPPALQFSIVAVQDPYGCNTDPVYGLTSYGPSSPTAGTVSVYRRPLPTANVPFLTAFMWDGREPSLESQAIDAAMIHFQSPVGPASDQIAQIVSFESGLYSAQFASDDVSSLNRDGASGGPLALSKQSFYVGINDVLGGDPTGAAFNQDAMTNYTAWQGLTDREDAQAIVARGEQLFNEKPIAIGGVAGLNDQLGLPTVNGFCTTCHDTPNVGNHSVKLPIDIGVVAPSATGLDTSGLPVFTLSCNSGPLAGHSFQVTDPGKALISGECGDIGKTKGPILRGLASRAPYFHNGAAPDLEHVVDFYDTRFGIGFTKEERAALVSFLKKL
jgi:cytochrome c peroxidase